MRPKLMLVLIRTPLISMELEIQILQVMGKRVSSTKRQIQLVDVAEEEENEG